MVQIQVKQGEEKQFVYECECTKGVEEMAKDVIEIHNLQAKIQHLVLALGQLLQGCHPDSVVALRRALSEAETYASKDQILYNRPLSLHVLRYHMQNLERESFVNQSIGFSDPIQFQNLFSEFPDLELLCEDITQLWWAGKELRRSKRLCDYVGKNEKTKILLKLRSPGPDPASHSDMTHYCEDTISNRRGEARLQVFWS